MEELRRRRLTASGGGRWFSTAASILIQCTSGSLYTFSIYSQAIKSTQSYDQSTLDTVSVVKDIGASTGIISGILYSRVAPDHGDGPRRRSLVGPWVVLLVGAILCFAGYFSMWMCTVGLISRPPVPLMCFFMVLASHAQTFFNTANVVTAVRNFLGYSGTAVGIMKPGFIAQGYLGLSGAILVQTYQVIFGNNPIAYLLMLAFLPTANTLLLMWFVRIQETSQRDDKKHLNRLSLMALVLAAYVMVVLILDHVFTFHLAIRVSTLVILLGLLATPLCIAMQAQKEELNDIQERPFLEGDHLTYETRDDNGEMNEENMPQPGEDINLLQSVRTLNFWILFFAMACGMGSGLSTVNNMSQIGESLGYSSFETSTLVSLWSVWNFLGRFGAGYISDYFLRLAGWARPLFMVITLGIMSIGHLLIASGLRGTLYAGSVLVGVCYGSQWSLMPTVVSEIFGVGHMGTIFNAITVASPVGSYIFSVRLVGYIYDKEASIKGNTCVGIHCFMLSFLIMAFATAFGSLTAFSLFIRTKGYYNQVILRRLLEPERR